MNDYIYLDWNVYKYLKKSREIDRDKAGHEVDLKMKSLVQRLSAKYKFPYSEGHIKDAANKYTPEKRNYIEDDFSFAETINHQECIGYGYVGSRLVFDTQRKPMLDLFDEFIEERAKKPDIAFDEITITPFPVDMKQIKEDHPLYDFLISNNGIMDMGKLNTYLVSMVYELFTGTEFYKKLREYVDKLDKLKILNMDTNLGARLLLDRHLYYIFPFLDSFDDEEGKLARKWPGIVYHYLKMNNPNPTIEMQLIQGYTLLDMHPFFREKLKKNKNTLDNIVRDGTHCFYASKARYFISEDEGTREKTKLIYKAYGIRTKFVSEAEFLDFFEVVSGESCCS